MARTLSTKVLLALLVVVTLAILTGSYVYYRSETNRIRQSKYEDIAAIAELKVGHIQHWRKGLLNNARVFSLGPLFRKGVEEWLRDLHNEPLASELRGSLFAIQELGPYADALLLDRDSNVLLSVSQSPEPSNLIEKKALQQAIASGSPALSGLYLNQQGEVIISAVAAITTAEGRLVAVGMFRSYAKTDLYPLIESWPTSSKTSETLLVRREDDSLLFLNNLRHSPKAALTLREPLTLTSLPAVQAVLGKKGMFQGTDYGGQEVLADLRPIPDSPWVMVAKVDTSEILEEARYRGFMILVFCGLFVLLAVTMTAYGYGHQQAGLYKDLYRSEREQREMREEYRTTLYSIGDAVITTDTAGIVKQMNPVAEDLTGWKEADAKGKLLDEVFHIINEDSRGSVQNPVGRVLQDGMVIGLANHTVLIAKDGSERPIADSGAPIRNEQGIITGVVLVFRDQTAKRKYERELEEKEQVLQATSRMAQVGGWDVDANSLEVRWTEETYRLHEVPLDHKPALEEAINFFHEDDRARLKQAIQNSLKLGEPYDMEIRFVTATGKQLWTRIICNPEIVNGKTVKLRGTFQDITQRKRAEEELRETSEYLENLVGYASAPIIVWDPEFKITRFNRAFQTLTGRKAKDVIGHSLEILFPSDQVEPSMERIKRTLTGERWEAVEIGVLHMDGSIRTVLWNSATILAADGLTPAATIAQGVDITERKQAEQALKASEMRYRRLFEAAKDGILILDAETAQIVDVNPFLTDLLGYSREDFLERKIWEIGIFEDASKSQAVFLELQSREYVRYEDLPLQKKGGSSVDVEFVSNVYQINGKKVIQCNIRDISARKRLERQLIQSQKMEAVGILAGGVAHDFNNLLTVVQGYSELFLMEMDEKAPGYSDLRKIHEAGLRGAELVRNLLAFSRKADTNPRPINLNDEVARIQKLLSRTIPKMIKTELHLEGDLAAVAADPDQIGQVLMNLAVNSEHAMPEGGQLTIATANISLDEEFCRSYPEMHAGNYAMLTVSDTGHGMDKETLQHIFEPFFTTKGVGKGTGLGLSMVYGIIRQHGGHITCYSEPNHGTTFKIYLPAMKEDVMGREAEVEQVLPSGGTETILLVDDEDFIRDLGQRFLTRAGYTVLTAASGPEAVQLYLREGEKISLMILDLIMPEMGGDKCLEEILAINPDAKIVISSGAAVEGKKKETVESGARGFVSKPFQLRDMLKTVREVLDER